MKRLSIILFVFFICACEMIVDVDVPFEGERLVVNSFFCPDSLWSASIGLNRFILAGDAYEGGVRDAIVTVHDENGLVATLQYAPDDKYRSQTEKPVAGKQYAIHVSAPNYPAAEATATIPMATIITSVEIEKGATEITKVTFADNADTRDFYHIRLEVVEAYYNEDTDQISFRTSTYPSISSDNPDLNSQYIAVDDGLLVKDVLFNGKQTEVGVKMENGYYPSYFAGVRVVLRSVSEDYYNYMASKKLQEETSGDPFAQPVNLYNNIAGGFGIFAGLSNSIFVYNYPQPVITEISPSSGKVGDVITITGQNFEIPNSTSSIGIQFNGPDGYRISVHWSQITEITDTQLKVVVPEGAITGKIMMSRGTSIALSDLEFVVTN